MLEKSKYEVIFMNQTCNSTEKKQICLKKPIFLKSVLTNDILTILFSSCWILYNNFHSFILEQCQNNCPAATQVSLVVLVWIQHNINVLLILLLLSHKDFKLRSVSWRSPSTNSLVKVTRDYRFQMSILSKHCLIAIIVTNKLKNTSAST